MFHFHPLLGHHKLYLVLFTPIIFMRWAETHVSLAHAHLNPWSTLAAACSTQRTRVETLQAPLGPGPAALRSQERTRPPPFSPARGRTRCRRETGNSLRRRRPGVSPGGATITVSGQDTSPSASGLNGGPGGWGGAEPRWSRSCSSPTAAA